MKDNQPSATAKLIARSMLLLSQNAGHAALIPPQSAEMSGWCLEACGENPARFCFLARQPWFRRLLYLVEQSTTPGLLLHYILRKRQIEEAVRESLAAGAQQVVILGAGFDSLAWLLHRQFPNAKFWELDHPATQKVKQAALAAHGVLGHNLHFAALNLVSEHLADALVSEPMYQAGVETVFVAEGLLMYLNPERVSGVFREAHKASAAGSRFAFTFLEPQSNGRVGFARSSHFVDWWLRQRGEPFRWGLGQMELAAFLDEHGWGLHQIIAPSALRRHYLTEEPPLPVVGDLIGLATWKPE